MWDAEGVLQSGYNCIHYFPDFLRPYERIARVYSDLNYEEDMEKLLADAKEKKLESVYLDAYRYRMTHEIPDNDTLDKKLEEFREAYLKKVEDGFLEYYEKGLPLITEYLYWCPGAYMLVERGLFHKAAAHYDEALADFKKALEEEPGNPYALNAMAYCYKLKGDYEQALINIRKAIFYFEEEYTRTYSDMGDLYSLLGENKMALEAYMEVLRVGGDSIRENGYYMRNYAKVLVKNKQVSQAESVLHKAYKEPFEKYNKLVDLFYASGEEEKCRTALQQWKKAIANSTKVVKQSDYANYYGAMAWHELVFGEGKKALEYFEKGLQCRKQEKDVTGYLCDTIFACILCGEEERGKVHAARLRDFMKEERESAQNKWLDMDKLSLERDLLIQYYFAPLEEFEATLEREKETAICYFCTSCYCMEIEGIRVLHMLRTGKEKEAMEYVESHLVRQPVDEYMRAIQNICKDGVKVVPCMVSSVENPMQKEQAKPKKEAIKSSDREHPPKEVIKSSDKVPKAAAQQSSTKRQTERNKKENTVGESLKNLFQGLLKKN